jgi:hypothetical protein
MTLLSDKVINPNKFAPGARHVKTYGYAAPKLIMELLQVPVTILQKPEYYSQEEGEIEDFSSDDGKTSQDKNLRRPPPDSPRGRSEDRRQPYDHGVLDTMYPDSQNQRSDSNKHSKYKSRNYYNDKSSSEDLEPPTKTPKMSQSHKYKRSRSSEEQKEEELQAVWLKFLEKQKAKLTIPETDSEEEDQVSRFQVWKSFKLAVQDSVEEFPETLPDPKLHRTAGQGRDREYGKNKVPIHPEVEFALQECMNAVQDNKGTPIPVGQTLKSTRKFPHNYMDLGNLQNFSSAQRKTKLTPMVPEFKATFVQLTNAEIESQETMIRETVTMWSHMRWAMQSMENILQSENIPEMEGSMLRSITDQLKDFSPLMDDRLSTLLANTALKRRDVFLGASSAKNLKEDSVSQLRSSSLLQPELFQIHKEIRRLEEAEKASRDMLQAMRNQTVNVNIPGLAKLTGQFPQANNTKPAEQTTPAQTTTTSAVQDSFQTSTSTNRGSGYRNFKDRRNKQSFRGRGGYRGGWRGNQNYRGRANYSNNSSNYYRGRGSYKK